MTATGNMSSTEISELKKHDWYIQGINAVPAYIAAGPVSGLFGCKKTLGYHYTRFLVEFQNDYCELHYSKSDLLHVFGEFMKRFRQDSGYLDWAVATSEKQRKPMENYLKKMNLGRLSDQKLVEEYRHFSELFYDCFAASHLVEAIALSSDELVKESIQKALEKKGREKDFSKVFTLLTQPTKMFFFSNFNRNMVSFAQKIGKNQKLKKLLGQNSETVVQGLSKFPVFQREILAHQEEFFWIKSLWNIGNRYSTKEVIEDIQAALSNPVKGASERVLLQNMNSKKRILAELEASKELCDLIEITDVVTGWQDERKIIMLSGVWGMERFVEEMSRRFGVEEGLIKYLLPDEIKTPDDIRTKKTLLAERRKKSVYLYYGEHREILSGADYDLFKQKGSADIKAAAVWELSGMCASMGRAMGTVKVCLTQESISKVNEGDILVTTMTRPEFVSVMKKAAAIVTDEGGITCHAAVISRELGIPCVIATKQATKVFKDGDIVEVNANHGLVKKLGAIK